MKHSAYIKDAKVNIKLIFKNSWVTKGHFVYSWPNTFPVVLRTLLKSCFTALPIIIRFLIFLSKILEQMTFQ